MKEMNPGFPNEKELNQDLMPQNESRRTPSKRVESRFNSPQMDTSPWNLQMSLAKN
jgi:hypothetical protein